MSKEKTILKIIESDAGPRGVLIATTVVAAFAQGILPDRRKGILRGISDDDLRREQFGRVASALKSMLIEHSNDLTYDRYAPAINFLDKSDQKLSFRVDGFSNQNESRLADQVYTLMETYHSKYMKPVKGVYLPRNTYNMTLKSVLNSVAYVT